MSIDEIIKSLRNERKKHEVEIRRIDGALKSLGADDGNATSMSGTVRNRKPLDRTRFTNMQDEQQYMRTRLLELLHEHGPMTVAQAHEAIGMRSSATVLNRLRELDLAGHVDLDVDARPFVASLSDKEIRLRAGEGEIS